MTAQPSGTSRSLPRWLLYLLSGARFAGAAAIGCLASAVFYAATLFAFYLVLLLIAGVMNLGMGSPIAGPIWTFVFFCVGLGAALIVYTPITLLTAALARKRIWVWLLAPILVVCVSFGVGILLAMRFEARSCREHLLPRHPRFRAPLLLRGGYCLYWLFLFTSCQLGPWLLEKWKTG